MPQADAMAATPQRNVNAVEGCHRDADLKDRCSGRASCRLFGTSAR